MCDLKVTTSFEQNIVLHGTCISDNLPVQDNWRLMHKSASKIAWLLLAEHVPNGVACCCEFKSLALCPVMRSRHNNDNAEDQLQAMQHPHDDSLCFNISLHLGPSRKGSEESKHSIGGKWGNQLNMIIQFVSTCPGPKRKKGRKKNTFVSIQKQKFKIKHSSTWCCACSLHVIGESFWCFTVLVSHATDCSIDLTTTFGGILSWWSLRFCHQEQRHQSPQNWFWAINKKCNSHKKECLKLSLLSESSFVWVCDFQESEKGIKESETHCEDLLPLSLSLSFFNGMTTCNLCQHSLCCFGQHRRINVDGARSMMQNLRHQAIHACSSKHVVACWSMSRWPKWVLQRIRVQQGTSSWPNGERWCLEVTGQGRAHSCQFATCVFWLNWQMDQVILLTLRRLHVQWWGVCPKLESQACNNSDKQWQTRTLSTGQVLALPSGVRMFSEEPACHWPCRFSDLKLDRLVPSIKQQEHFAGHLMTAQMNAPIQMAWVWNLLSNDLTTQKLQVRGQLNFEKKLSHASERKRMASAFFPVWQNWKCMAKMFPSGRLLKTNWKGFSTEFLTMMATPASLKMLFKPWQCLSCPKNVESALQWPRQCGCTTEICFKMWTSD